MELSLITIISLLSVCLAAFLFNTVGSRMIRLRSILKHLRRSALTVEPQAELGAEVLEPMGGVRDHSLSGPAGRRRAIQIRRFDQRTEAAPSGIDAAFEKWRGRKVKTQMVNSLAFCAQAVLTEAKIMDGTADTMSGAAGDAHYFQEETPSLLETARPGRVVVEGLVPGRKGRGLDDAGGREGHLRLRRPRRKQDRI